MVSEAYSRVKDALKKLDEVKEELSKELSNLERKVSYLEAQEREEDQIPSTFVDKDIIFVFPDYHITLEERYKEELSDFSKNALKKLVEVYENNGKEISPTELATSDDEEKSYSSALYYLYMAGFLVREEKNGEVKYYPREEALSIVKSQ